MPYFNIVLIYFENIIGNSKNMFYFFYRMEKYMDTQSILTGKSKVALVINGLGPS